MRFLKARNVNKCVVCISMVVSVVICMQVAVIGVKYVGHFRDASSLKSEDALWVGEDINSLRSNVEDYIASEVFKDETNDK